MKTKLALSTHEAMKPMYGAIFIHTPGIDQVPHFMLVQKLIEHRIRCMLQEVQCDDIAVKLVTHYLTVPNGLDKQKDIEKFYAAKANEIRTAFVTFEQTNRYKEDLALLVPHKGRPFSITSITTTGLQIVIDLLPG